MKDISQVCLEFLVRSVALEINQKHSASVTITVFFFPARTVPLSNEVTARKELCPLMFVFVSCCRYRLQGITCEYSTDIDEVPLEYLCHL